ncbi:laminin subunit beta-1 isoform X2 [Neocloeon triangulifer]|uniref:laminin subunit beta-1 isoform X2 n=1 Tax=Neocloeon triangulifer TaxID=2078957 RepID=UPI00286F53C6|nr:laminin subunit beta-1 isoform X2 [Neocloeon triangulifer]
MLPLGSIYRITLVLLLADSVFAQYQRERGKNSYYNQQHKTFRARPLFNNPSVSLGNSFREEQSVEDSNVHPLTRTTSNFRERPNTGRAITRLHPCEQSSCYPATGNLLIGRESRLSATSTCGIGSQERFCIVSHLEERKKCFWCDSRDANRNEVTSHRISNIVNRYGAGQSSSHQHRTWWQSKNGVENVSIQLDLEAEFHFTHLIITFKTFRPAAMLIERSYDFGRNWQVYRYFAYNCEESFPGVPRQPPRTKTDIICESRYSSVAPSTEGEVIFRVLPPNIPIEDPYSQEVQNLLKVTNLRVNFTKLHTLGDDLLDNRQEIQEKYYYSIYEMVVRGSCSCYGHASRCLPLSNVLARPDMVHGRCECTHNTQGLNCEQCKDFFNDLPWKPAVGKQSNACKMCNCNNHTNSCHFDEAVYEASGRVSGGVCDGCQHFTQGYHCEECKPFYYQYPNRDITDPYACQPCDCDLRGSLDEGICDSKSDPAADLESGRCHCKKNVEGRRCDRCMAGFWNFSEENPEGCEKCSCNSLGTHNNQGCDFFTGECTCKRFVTGRDCNQCLPQFYGLSEELDGCKACDCDPGGSFDNDCDVITGQCRCRPNVGGRTCNEPVQGYFVGYLDYNVYEAEYARGTEKCQVIIREPYRDGREQTWTGIGFMKVFENSEIEFDLGDIRTSMDYDIVIRYEPLIAGGWSDVKVILKRPFNDTIDPNGPCAKTVPEDDIKSVSLPTNGRSTAVYPPVCLEANKDYKLVIQFRRHDPQSESPTATILIDSIALVPRPEELPFFQGNQVNEIKRDEYERYRCHLLFQNVNKGQIPEICRDHYFSIGVFVHDGANECQCDLTGSTSTLCNSLGGQCDCKPNVVGRKCNRCAPGTFGFGPEGCKACDCNSIGSQDNFCDVQSGQCKCRPNTYGRECDQCQPGFWGFPNCQRCECHGHADVCDSRTGACTACRDSTQGHHCDRCIEGYYGDPRIGYDIQCRPCPCPGTVESGHSYASICALDPLTQDVVCECEHGYAGPRCDICADNYYGNPDEPGGTCQLCECNGNIDVSIPGNCDGRTGECQQCLFNTEGFSCDVCKANYYGDAINKLCTECICNILGTDKAVGECDRSTGQCPCLPNVVGLSCDQCAENHWKIASGEGCEACDCDPVGSTSDQCNQYDGQCECREGFGGRRCNECQANFWGNPTVECMPCNCNIYGSETMQCHRNNGSCVCTAGIGGEKCDQCARGFIGTAPYCEPCGECFDNWDRILEGLQERTNRAIQSASDIKQTGATGAYTREFENMEKKISEVKQLLESSKVSSSDLDNLRNNIDDLRANLTSATSNLEGVEGFLQNQTQRLYDANITLINLRNDANALKMNADTLKENATRLQEANVEGALNLTREAYKRSQDAQDQAELVKTINDNAERNYKRTESLVGRASELFAETKMENEKSLNSLSDRLSILTDEIPELNEHVCGRRGDPCDNLCGGAGCDQCGGLSCEEGAVTKAVQSMDIARDNDQIIKEKETKAEELFRGITQASVEAANARDLAKEANMAAMLTKNRSESGVQDNNELLIEVNGFLVKQRATPEEIKNLAQEVLSKKIQLEPAQISDLAQEINNTIASLTNIDDILAETSDDLLAANNLKVDSDAAKAEAEEMLERAKKVVEDLAEAASTQGLAEAAIEKANKDISTAEKDLTQIASEMTEAQQKSNETLAEVDSLLNKIKRLQTKFLKNERDAREVNEEAKSVATETQAAQTRGLELQTAYKNAEQLLKSRSANARQSQEKVAALLKKASELSVGTLAKFKELKGMEASNQNNEGVLVDLSNEIEELNEKMKINLVEINQKSDYYRNCVS